jgi:hypothetical protein
LKADEKNLLRKTWTQVCACAEYDSDFLDSFTQGTHLLMVYPGGKSQVNIDPNYAVMIAAGRVAEDAICRAISNRPAKCVLNVLRLLRTTRKHGKS